MSAVAGVKRVGHKGADLIEPGNTPASFDAALAAGVDMIEFDVLPRVLEDRRHSELLLAHDYEHPLADRPTLDEGLDHLAGTAFADIELDVDLKAPDYEERVLAALRERELLSRSLITSMYPESLARVRAIDPAVRVGWSIPKVRRDYAADPLLRYPAAALLMYGRRIAPRHVGDAVRAGRVDAVMAFHRLITPRLVRTVRDAGRELYAWTVDDAERIAHLAALGVTGVITNDPRLFDARAVAATGA